MTSAARQRTFPYRCWRQTPTSDGRDDREQRRRLGVQLRQAEPRQRRDEEDAAADAEEAGEHAGDDAEEHREDVRHWRSIRIAIADEERGEQERERAHGQPLLERRPAERADRRRDAERARVARPGRRRAAT